MYIPPVFGADEATAWEYVAERGFGTIVALSDGVPVASHVPFLATGNSDARRISFHIARANPLGGLLASAPKALLIVSGPDGYISPDWYESPNQVPTWNYVSVHMTGTARVLPSETTLEHVDALSARFEARLQPKRPWTTAKMPPALLERMLAAITPVELAVESIEAQWKLSQNKTAADQAGVMRMLDWQGDWPSLALAEMMRARAARLQQSRPADPAGVSSSIER